MPTTSEVRLRSSLAANASLGFSDPGVFRVGGQHFTTKLGGTTSVGTTFKLLAPTYDRSTDLFPFVKCTYTRGQTEYAKRRTGEEVIVGEWNNGNLIPTRNGETYYGQNRSEWLLEVPSLVSLQLKNAKGKWVATGPGQLKMLPSSSLTLEATDGIEEYPSLSRLRNFATLRHNEQAPLTLEEK